jgi:hypothetical protein
MMPPERYSFHAGQNPRNRAFRISGFQTCPKLPFHAAVPELERAGRGYPWVGDEPTTPQNNPQRAPRVSEKELHGRSGIPRVNVGIRASQSDFAAPARFGNGFSPAKQRSLLAGLSILKKLA